MSQKSIDEAQAYLSETAEELNDLVAIDTMEMYRQLTKIGDGLVLRGEPAKTPENFVHGCTSNVYIEALNDNGVIQYRGSSEALVVRGYVAILVEALSGLSAADIVGHTEAMVSHFAEETNIRATLTPSRANAFGNIYRLMKDKAHALGK